MTSTAITVEGIGKKFRIGSYAPYHRLSESFIRLAKGGIDALSRSSAKARVGSSKKREQQDFWAIEDISFELLQGRVLGIIGRNGAGKSTLLKVLARITEPTVGRFGIRGRVGSLLEVGTGFHPELTGRENIYLSGTLLGMSRNDVRTHFDDIVEFAETERFLDTPVKRYSSGMRVRLGFAVAAHLNPDILIVDEVLAVGDAAFQQKCMGKMNRFASDGRTILFVSHNMAAVQNLCTNGILIEHGRISVNGTIGQCVDAYLERQRRQSGIHIRERTDRRGSGRYRIDSIEIVGDGKNAEVFAGGSLRVNLSIAASSKPESTPPSDLIIALILKDANGQPWMTLHTRFSGDRIAPPTDAMVVQCEVPQLPLTPGEYFLNVRLKANSAIYDVVEDAAVIEVHEHDFFGTGQLPTPTKHGRVIAPHRFRVIDA